MLHVHRVSDLGSKRQRYKDFWLHCCLRSSTKKPRCNLGPSCKTNTAPKSIRPLLCRPYWPYSYPCVSLETITAVPSSPHLALLCCTSLLHGSLFFSQGNLFLRPCLMTTSSTSSKSKHQTISLETDSLRS